MYPLTHFLVAFFIGLLMVKYNGFGYLHALYTGLFGLLIDVDHFIYYVTKKRDFNLRNAWNASVKYMFYGKDRMFIHHLSGFFIMVCILVILFFISKIWFWIVFIGYFSHMVLDYIEFVKWFGKDKKVKFNLFGFIIKVHIYELIFDMILVILLFLL